MHKLEPLDSCHAILATVLLIVVGTTIPIYAQSGQGPSGMVWVYVDDPGVPEHEGFHGYISKYETTNDQYCEFLNEAISAGQIIVYNDVVYSSNDPCYIEPYFITYTANGTSQIIYTEGGFAVQDRDDLDMGSHPVILVTWYGAKAFCDFYGWRLPTYWEWRAVADYDGTYNYGCGISLSYDLANYENQNPIGLTSNPHTTPVGYYGDFGYGLCDLAGNAWEWTSSESTYGYIANGGCWSNTANYCLVVYGVENSPEYTSYVFGFRACHGDSETLGIEVSVKEGELCNGIVYLNELNSLELWQDGDFLQRVTPDCNPYTFSGLDPLHEYRVDAYINDMGVGSFSVTNTAGDVSGTICAGERVQIDATVTNESGDPSEGVTVELVSHEGRVWRTGLTDSAGDVEWDSPSDPSEKTARAYVMPATLQNESWRVVARRYGSVVGSSELLTRSTPHMEPGDYLPVNINNLPNYGESTIGITDFHSSLGLLEGQPMPRNTWVLHIQPTGSLDVILEYEWGTDTPAVIQGYISAYGPTGLQGTPKQIWGQAIPVEGYGSGTFTFDENNLLPGDPTTYELVVTLFIYNGEYGFHVPTYVDHAVLSIPENMPENYRPPYPNVTSARQDVLAIQRGSFTTDIAELSVLYNQYSNAYADIRRNLRQEARDGVEEQIWEAMDVIMPPGLSEVSGVFIGRYQSVPAAIIGVTKGIFSGLGELAVPYIKWFQIGAYIESSYEKSVAYEQNVETLQMYGYICDHIQAFLARPIVNASDGDYADKVSLSWSAVNDAVSYKVFRATTPDLSDNTLIADDVAECVYDDFTVLPEDVYYYSIYTNIEDRHLWSQPDEGHARLDLDLTISSLHGSPNPEVGDYIFPAGTIASSGSVTSPCDDDGTRRFVCIGYVGTGSAPSGSGTSYLPFVLTEASRLTWQWKTQYVVSSESGPGGIMSQNPVGWYDAGTLIQFVALPGSGFVVDKWLVNDSIQMGYSNSLAISVDGPVTVEVRFTQLAISDLNEDRSVNLLDFMILCEQWLQAPSSCSADIAPEPNGDGKVDMRDFAVFAENWLIGND
ncbi:MAG: SUMF1/EgtB/PvdO family nonheme iron enzyme [Sedimentisphaerales bacterium]|nr:SUMF1/EgtB/PvdO family nonheme iron enzyme [Sedimentisphaerales bacterium]